MNSLNSKRLANFILKLKLKIDGENVSLSAEKVLAWLNIISNQNEKILKMRKWIQLKRVIENYILFTFWKKVGRRIRNPIIKNERPNLNDIFPFKTNLIVP